MVTVGKLSVRRPKCRNIVVFHTASMNLRVISSVAMTPLIICSEPLRQNSYVRDGSDGYFCSGHTLTANFWSLAAASLQSLIQLKNVLFFNIMKNKFHFFLNLKHFLSSIFPSITTLISFLSNVSYFIKTFAIFSHSIVG